MHLSSQPLDAEFEAARLAAIVSSSDDAIISKTLDGVITSWNAAASRILGYAPEEMIGQPIMRIIPDELRAEEDSIIARLRRGERVEHFDTVRVRKDGSQVPLSITVSPIRDSTGRVVGASKVARDISDRKRHEELQQVMFDELNHRVKNMLATVQALAIQSLRGERSLAEARQTFESRLRALSAVHDRLSRQDWRSASLDEVVYDTLRPFADRVRADGPPVALPARQAITWGMIVHELATNAARHGALSIPAGRIAVTWREMPDDTLQFEWSETDGPAASPPPRRGFGTAFVERAAAGDLNGAARFEFLPQGLRVAITARPH